MTTSTVRPCVFPGCRDGDGNPQLTDQVICPASRRRYRRVLDWLVEDYALLHAELGQLASATRERVAESKVYGHPAEHLSTWKRRIAEILNSVHEALADHRSDLPPPDLAHHSEARLVILAHRYLTVRFDALCAYPGAEAAATELAELHAAVRGVLGHARRPVRLQAACPDCDLLTMARHVERDGSEWIECGACGCVISPAEYAWYARLLAAEAGDEQAVEEAA